MSRGDKGEEVYSFSKLSAMEQCPYSWYLTYIKHSPQVDNAFSLYGSFVHELLEGYANGEYELDVLPDLYEWGFEDAVTVKFPPNKYTDLHDSYYESGLKFLQNWNGYDRSKILGVEEHFQIPMDGYDFQGFIDISFVDEQGRMVLRDYKSSKTISKTDLPKKRRQLYLYSLYFKEAHGQYPDVLQFYTFRNPDKPVIEIPFDETDLAEAIQWANETVAQIRDEWEYDKKPDDWFCHQLCGHRETCPCGQTKGVA